MRRIALSVIGPLLVLGASAANAAETVSYSYDARGRLVKVVRSGGPNGTKTTDYTLDKADNRTGKTVGSSVSLLAIPLDDPSVVALQTSGS